MSYELESVYTWSFPVMPDLIRHPDIVPTKVGNHFKELDFGFRRNDDLFRTASLWTDLNLILNS